MVSWPYHLLPCFEGCPARLSSDAFDTLSQTTPMIFQHGDNGIINVSYPESSECEISEANEAMPAGFLDVSYHFESNSIYCESFPLGCSPIFVTMKLNRDYIVLSLCFILLACGLGLVVAVVSLSPSLGMFNSTQVYVPEDIGRDCVNCTIVPISAANIERFSMPTCFIIAGLAVGMSMADLI